MSALGLAMIRWIEAGHASRPCQPGMRRSLAVKINTDGAAKGNLGLAGAGCVIRDRDKNWLVRAAQNLGITTLVAATLWAIYHGLNLDWERGYMSVVLETDSQVAY